MYYREGGLIRWLLLHVFLFPPRLDALHYTFVDPGTNAPQLRNRLIVAVGATLLNLPLTLPGIIVTSMFAFVFSWNNVVFPLILSNQSTATLPVGTMNYCSTHSSLAAPYIRHLSGSPSQTTPSPSLSSPWTSAPTCCMHQSKHA